MERRNHLNKIYVPCYSGQVHVLLACWPYMAVEFYLHENDIRMRLACARLEVRMNNESRMERRAEIE